MSNAARLWFFGAILSAAMGLLGGGCGDPMCGPETSPDPAGNCPIVEETASPSPDPA